MTTTAAARVYDYDAEPTEVPYRTGQVELLYPYTENGITFYPTSLGDYIPTRNGEVIDIE